MTGFSIFLGAMPLRRSRAPVGHLTISRQMYCRNGNGWSLARRSGTKKENKGAPDTGRKFSITTSWLIGGSYGDGGQKCSKKSKNSIVTSQLRAWRVTSG